jgi:hypothetical protein
MQHVLTDSIILKLILRQAEEYCQPCYSSLIKDGKLPLSTELANVTIGPKESVVL